MTYSTVSDIRREFKSVLDNGNVITDSRIIEFQLQNYALINSHLGTKFTIPITGTAPVNQIDTITFVAAAGAGEVKTITISGNGSERDYIYITLGADTAEVIRDAIQVLILADKDKIVDETASSTDKLILESKVSGFSYTIVISGTGAPPTSANDQVAVLGSNGLRMVRRLETELTACKIADILRVKVNKALTSSGVKQDIKDGSCGRLAIKSLKQLTTGEIELEDADLIQSGSGLESHNQINNFVPKFDRERRQW